MPRFVVLTHDHPFPHMDFMLEDAGRLRTWRLLSEPDFGEPFNAEALPDHRLLYLDYEGPISDGRGTVARWDTGSCEWIEVAPDRLTVQVNGEKLSGRVVLTRGSIPNHWTLHLTRV